MQPSVRSQTETVSAWAGCSGGVNQKEMETAMANDTVATQFSAANSVFYDDPYPIYERLRDHAPAYLDEGSGLWMITRYQDVERACTDYETFSSGRGNAVRDNPARVGKTLGTMDPPRHDELRRVIQRALSPSRIEAMRGVVRELARAQLDELRDKREFDFIADYSYPVIFTTLGVMLGLDEVAARRAAVLSGRLFEDDRDPVGPGMAAPDFAEVLNFLKQELAKRSASPAEDLISVLLQAQADGAPLSNDEIVANMSTVLLAGNASLGHFFPNIIHSLWRHPDQRRQVLSDPGLIPAAIEEAVRWDTSTQSFGREVMKDVDIDGTTVPAGSRAVIFYASANRDERVIDNASTFDIHRKRVRHFGFGLGPHFCAGSSMAKMVSGVLLEDLLPFLGEFDLDVQKARRVRHIMVRGFKSLPISRQ